MFHAPHGEPLTIRISIPILEFTSKRNEVKADTESENGKFERKQRQTQRLMDAEQMKIQSLEVKQSQLLDER